MHRLQSQRLALLAACGLQAACATVSPPRFPFQEVNVAFARDEMRKLETAELEVYYPAAHRDAALRLAARAQECLVSLRARGATQRPRERGLLFLTTANFNNAYVTGNALGEPLHSVAPLAFSSELFQLFNLPSTEPGEVSCHEMLHYAHHEQIEGFWRLVNAVLGPVAPSQSFIESWFTEGVAQYYEGRLGRRVGRPHSPVYRGAFEAVVAARAGHLRSGDLSALQRELLPFSGAYLTSLPFVEWLVDRFGEDKLWEVMDRQARSFFSPLGVSLRFASVYGEGIGELVDAWSAAVRAASTAAPRVRPEEQTSLRRELGFAARLASHPASGAVALVTMGTDEGPRLRILEADGRVRAERSLVDIAPWRRWVLSGPLSLSGLAFAPDGRRLLALNEDLTADGDLTAHVWELDAASGALLRSWPLGGAAVGGDLHPDGQRYLFVQVSPGSNRLAELELSTGTITALPSPGAELGVSVGGPRYAPDGRRIVYARFARGGWDLALREASGAVRPLTDDGAFNVSPQWAGPSRVLFVRSAPDGRAQAHRLDLDTGAVTPVTDAPFAVMDPAPAADRVVFLNRDGFGWSVDTVPAPPAPGAAPAGAPLAGASVADAPPSPPAAAPQPTAQDAVPVAASTAPSPESRAPDLVASEPAPGAATAAPLAIEADTPYSPFDGLFVPKLRVPGATLDAAPSTSDPGRVELRPTLFASLAGRDRLGRHSWALNGTYGTATGDGTLAAEYANLALAPWLVWARASLSRLGTTRTLSGSLSGTRTVFTTPLEVAWDGIAQERPPPAGGARFERYIGPRLQASWGAAEATPAGGARRALSFGASAALYPKAVGSTRDVLDVSATLGASVPLPLWSRHALDLGLSGRALPGAPADALSVGGRTALAQWTSLRERAPSEPGLPLLPGAHQEPVRGYEDVSYPASALARASLRYRARFVIDRGTASTLFIFPSTFFRQVDLGAFAVAAVTNNPSARWLRAAGASLALRVAFMDRLPVSLGYQVAWRADQSLPLLHLVALSME